MCPTPEKEISTQKVSYIYPKKGIFQTNKKFFHPPEKIYFLLKEKISCTYLKKEPKEKISFNYQKKTIFQTKNFLYLPKKLTSYTCAKKLKRFVSDMLWIQLHCFIRWKLNRVFIKPMRVLVCPGIYIKNFMLIFLVSRQIPRGCPRCI